MVDQPITVHLTAKDATGVRRTVCVVTTLFSQLSKLLADLTREGYLSVDWHAVNRGKCCGW